MADLSREDIASYRKEGWKVIQTLIGMSYKATVWNNSWFFVREFYQNALDEHDEAGVAMPPVIEMQAEGMVIRDQGRGIGAESLLLAETKASAGDLRGQFGEGLKFACVTAVRMGYTPVFESEHGTIEAHQSVYSLGRKSEKVLTFLYKASSRSPSGTKVTVKGYHGDLYLDRFTTYLGKPLARTVVQPGKETGRFAREWAVYNQPPGRLYVGDIYIRDIPSKFSYNMWKIKLNPDRISTVDRESTLSGMARAWSSITDLDLMLRLVAQVVDDNTEENEINWWYYRPSDTIVQRAWQSLFGNAVLYTSAYAEEQAKGYRYKVVGADWGSRARDLFKRSGIATDAQVTEAVKAKLKPTIVAVKTLPLESQRIVSALQFLAKQSRQVSPEGVPIKDVPIYVATIPAELGEGGEVAGLYKDDTVYLVPGVLYDFATALGHFYHEEGHHLGGENARDGTTAHTKAVQQIAGEVSVIIENQVGEIRRILGVPAGADAPPPAVPARPVKEAPKSARELIWVESDKGMRHFDTPRMAGEWVGSLHFATWAVFWGDLEGIHIRDLSGIEMSAFDFGRTSRR